MWNFFVPIALAIGFPETITPAAAYEFWIFLCLILSYPNLAHLVEKTFRLDSKSLLSYHQNQKKKELKYFF